MRRPRAPPVLRRNALTRRLPFSGKHAEAVSEAIKMRRRNTIQRDVMHSQIKDEHIEHHVHA